MVELIVVIAIMAILVGALSPLLMKYIHKARLSSDIDTGTEIAKAIMACVVNDAVKDNAKEHNSPVPVNSMDGTDFKNAVFAMLGQKDSITGRSTKDTDGNKIADDKRQFYYTLDAEKNKVEVYYGGETADYQVYPVVGSKLVEQKIKNIQKS